MKVCFKCKIEKPFNEFYKSKKNGTQTFCKSCDNVIRKKNYYANHANERSKRRNHC